MAVLKYWDQVSGTYKTLTGPPGPTGIAYVVVSNTPPPQNNPVIAPPAGLLFADTSVPDPTTAYLPVTGGQMTGTLTLAAAPVSPLDATTKQYADTKLPLAGGTMTGPIAMAGGDTAVTQAPGDADTSVATTAFVGAAVAPAFNDVGRNKIHNGQFRINQRPMGPLTVSGWIADRWQLNVVTDTVSGGQAAVTDGHRAGIGDDDLGPYLLSIGVTGNSAAGAYTFVSQGIEDVARLAGKTVTLSFWCQASAALNVGLRLVQQFGTGGSPSTQVSAGTQTVAVSGTWKRCSWTLAMPTIQGKTIGTNNDSKTLLQVSLSSGSTNSGSLGVGVQSGTFNLWGFQLEIGSVMTQLEKLDPALELQQCQRFFQKSFQMSINPAQNTNSQNGAIVWSQGGAAGVTNWVYVTLQTRMRVTPGITLYNPVAANAQARNVVRNADATSTTVTIQGEAGFGVSFVTAAGSIAGDAYILHWSATADL